MLKCLCFLWLCLIASTKPTLAQHGINDIKPVYKLKGIQFAFKTQRAIRSTPVIVNGTVYFGSEDGNLYAIDSRSGREHWHFQTGGAVNSSPAITDGTIFFTSRSGYLYALSTTNGKEIWKFKLGNELVDDDFWDYHLSSPNITGKILYVGSGDGNLYAFDTHSKKTVWKFNAGSRIRTRPHVSANAIVFGTKSGYIYCLHKDGRLNWRFATDGVPLKFKDYGYDPKSIFCSPSVGDRIVTIGSRDGFIYGLNLETGKQIWKITQDSSSWISSTAIKDNQLFIGGGSAAIVQSVDLHTGIEKWRFQTNGYVFSSITVAGDMIYFTDFSGNCYGVDSNTGKQKWCFPMGVSSLSTPVVSNGLVYCSSDEGVLYALKGSTVPDMDTVVMKKVVYWEGNKTNTTYSAFPLSTGEYLRDYFIKNGYKLVDAISLKDFMQQQLVLHSHSVVVLADNKIPSEVVEEESPKALVRQYLDAGGKVAVFADNPLAYKTNLKTGALDSISYIAPLKILGISYLPREKGNGYFSSKATKTGEKWGLTGSWITNYANSTANVSAVLSVDEYGRASSWIKNFGGPEGTGWLQVWLQRDSFDLISARKAIEYGINW